MYVCVYGFACARARVLARGCACTLGPHAPSPPFPSLPLPCARRVGSLYTIFLSLTTHNRHTQSTHTHTHSGIPFGTGRVRPFVEAKEPELGGRASRRSAAHAKQQAKAEALAAKEALALTRSSRSKVKSKDKDSGSKGARGGRSRTNSTEKEQAVTGVAGASSSGAAAPVAPAAGTVGDGGAKRKASGGAGSKSGGSSAKNTPPAAAAAAEAAAAADAATAPNSGDKSAPASSPSSPSRRGARTAASQAATSAANAAAAQAAKAAAAAAAQAAAAAAQPPTAALAATPNATPTAGSAPSLLDEAAASVAAGAAAAAAANNGPASTPSAAGTPASAASTPGDGDITCTEDGCSKSFRKQSLLNSHMKHYHNVASPDMQQQQQQQPRQEQPPQQQPPQQQQQVPNASASRPDAGAGAGAGAGVARSSPPNGSAAAASAAAMDVDRQNLMAVAATTYAAAGSGALLYAPGGQQGGGAPGSIFMPDSSSSSLSLSQSSLPRREPSSRERNKRRRTSSSSSSLGMLGSSLGVGSMGGAPAAGVGLMLGDEAELDNSVTQCVCGHEDESEFMIQCERCNAWQHGDCVGLTELTLPTKYMCFGCIKSCVELDKLGVKVWQPRSYQGRLHVNYLPQAPVAYGPSSSRFGSRGQKVKGVGRKQRRDSTVTSADDKARQLLISRTERGILRDFATVKKCLRAVRLSLMRMAYDRSPGAAAKIASLVQEQTKCEQFVDTLTSDSECLEAAVAKLQALDDPLAMHRARHENQDSDSEEIPALLDATAELNRLFKKFDARQWKIYVNTEFGKVLR